jgi:hypothetical protein
MAKFNPAPVGSKFTGLDRPKNPKGLFVVPTGSASVLTVSASIKGGTVGSTKDINALLTNLEDGNSYEEAWHEAVHYLSKRVTELANGVNRVADAQSNLSGSSATSIATNKGKTGTTSTERARIVALHAASGSLSTRVTAEEVKNSPTCKPTLTIEVNRSNSLVITQGSGDDAVTWTIRADE